MIDSTLTLPHRESKPRSKGLTMMIDGGLPLGVLRDTLEGAGTFIDFVKFGWGTALVTGQLDEKIACLRDHDVSYYFGGTLFEKHVLQDRFDDFRALCLGAGCRYVEVSNGTIALSNTEKAGYIRKLADDFTVVSEVGFKDAARSENLPPTKWIDYIHEDLDAGAVLVTLEARESGRSGICRPNGEVRFGLIEELLTGDLRTDNLLFEAPNTGLQSYFLKRIGPDANLGNIASTDVIGLETLRLGLRADTLLDFG
jgi:phosphosulfolactate synthase